MHKTQLNGGAINKVYLNKQSQIVEYIYAQNNYLAFEIVERLPQNKLFQLYNKLGSPFPKYLQGHNFEYIGGEVIKHHQLNPDMIESLALNLHAIHNSNPADIATVPIGQRLNLFVKVLRYYSVYSAVFAYWINWLVKNQPKFTPVFIHGDYKLNNFKFNNNTVSGIFDLEFAKYSHCAEDIAWLFSPLWDNGWNQDNQQIFLNKYQAISGLRISANELFYWQIFTYIRFAVIAIQQYHRAGAVGSVELHITGWRTKQIENILNNMTDNNLKGFDCNKLYNFKLFVRLALQHKSLKYIIKGLLVYIKR